MNKFLSSEDVDVLCNILDGASPHIRQLRGVLEDIDRAINDAWLEDLLRGRTNSVADRCSLLWMRDHIRAALGRQRAVEARIGE